MKRWERIGVLALLILGFACFLSGSSGEQLEQTQTIVHFIDVPRNRAWVDFINRLTEKGYRSFPDDVMQLQATLAKHAMEQKVDPTDPSQFDAATLNRIDRLRSQIQEMDRDLATIRKAFEWNQVAVPRR